MSKTGVDHYLITRDEAFELMIHHLKLAAMYFEASPKVVDIKEYNRLMKGDTPNYEEPSSVAGRVWLTAITQFYREMELRDNE